MQVQPPPTAMSSSSFTCAQHCYFMQNPLRSEQFECLKSCRVVEVGGCQCSSQASQLTSVNTSLIVQVRSTRLVFSQHWFDCSSQTSQLISSSHYTMCHVWMISVSRLHVPGTDELQPNPHAAI